MKNKIAALFAMTAIMLTACTGNTNEISETSAEETTTSQTETEEAAAEITTAEETTAAEETTTAENGDYIVIRGEKYSTSLTELNLAELDLTDEDIKDLDKKIVLEPQSDQRSESVKKSD